jgi:ketosteroid isomerase-like protein
MGSEDNANMVRRGHAAFSTGDMAALSELFAGDAVWHVPGSGSLSGAKHGRDAILAFAPRCGYVRVGRRWLGTTAAPNRRI